MTTGFKLALGGVIIAGVTGYMAYLGAASSWQYYLTVDECLASADDLGDSRLRVHGVVSPDSLRIADDRSEAEFLLTGDSGQLSVVCAGPLPDNLSENMEVVVEGEMSGLKSVRGERVLTKCASKYESNESESAGNVRQASAATGARR